MNTQDFILACLRCYKGACEYMDKIINAFDIDMTEFEVLDSVDFVYENLKAHAAGIHLHLGDVLIARLFDKINRKAQYEYPEYAEQINELFGYYADDYASSLTFNDVEVHNWDELCQVIEEWINKQKQ